MINELKASSIAAFPDYVIKWTKIGYDTKPLDKELVTASVNKMYERGGFPAPKKIHFASGPHEAQIMTNMLVYMEKNPGATKKAVIAHVKKNLDFIECGYGQHDVSWISFYDFFQNETDIEGIDIIDGLKSMALNCGWYWAFNDFCVVAEKPYVCKTNDNNQLHCPDGPAIAYNDGTKIFCYDGVIMEEKYIMDHSLITTDVIANEENEEKKRIFIEMYGVSKYLTDIKAAVVHMDMVKINEYDPESDSIPRALIKDQHNNMYLVGTDGSTHRTYYMNVPNTVTTCGEAHNAISPLDENNCIASS